MNIAVIVIGDELLIGQVTDTNSGEIARTIAPAGWSVKSVRTVGDNPEDITDAITSALRDFDIVITTGGLGPTKDDITKEVLTNIFGGELRNDNSVLENVREICRKRNIELNELTARQAIVPTSCTVIQNEVGTAPLMWFERDGKVLVAMPGVPFETTTMLRRRVFPMLLKKFGSDSVIAHRTILIFNVIESEIAARLADFEATLPKELHLAYLPTPGLVRLRLDGIGDDSVRINRLLDLKQAEIEKEFGDNVVWSEDLPLPQILLNLLKEKGYTLATAESCTGGRIASAITSVPGASECFLGGVVAYQNEVKKNLLGVDSQSLEQYGAVSLPVAEQMATGVSRLIGTDCAIATSGIAGPGGGTPDKPVGTVCISVKTPHNIIVDHFLFPGNRARVIERSTNTAIIKLIRALKSI